jgi:hypothetical protein
MKLGLPLPQREQTLSDIQKGPSVGTWKERFQGDSKSFSTYTVRIDMPKYRMENGRTKAAQLTYIAAEKKPADFFGSDKAENNEVQAAQHKLLVSMAKSPKANLLQFFKSNKQDQPLILDSKGFVVNGNRRLAALRELYEEDKTAYAHFSHIEVVILPPCEERDILELEARLQTHPDIKDDYSWIATALMFREQSAHFDEEILARIHKKTPKDIRTELDKLAAAEEYLKIRDKEGNYLSLEKQDYAFEKLCQARGKLNKQPGRQQFLCEIVYRLIENPLGDRLYKSIPEALEVLDEIRSVIEEEILPEQVKNITADADKIRDTDIFGKTATPEDDAFIIATKALQNSTSADQALIIDAIRLAIQDKVEQDRISNINNYALKKITTANTNLADAVNGLGKTTSREGFKAQLGQIEQRIKEIRAWLEKPKAS